MYCTNFMLNNTSLHPPANHKFWSWIRFFIVFFLLETSEKIQENIINQPFKPWETITICNRLYDSFRWNIIKGGSEFYPGFYSTICKRLQNVLSRILIMNIVFQTLNWSLPRVSIKNSNQSSGDIWWCSVVFPMFWPNLSQWFSKHDENYLQTF